MMARTATAAVLACLLLAGLAVTASAQAAPPLPPKPGGTAPPRLTPPVPAPPKPQKTPPPVERPALSGEKVEILLRSGVLITGVVRGPRCEVIVGNAYRPAKDREAPGAGIRVWFAFGLNGYLFVPYEAMKEIRFPGELSPEEGRKLAESLAEGQKKAEEDRIKVAERLKAMKEAAAKAKAKEREGAGTAAEGEGSGKAEGARKGAKGGATAAEERMKKIRALLERFPPEKWKPSRLEEIKRRAVILDLYPTEEERAFMDHYDLWLQGYELWRREHPEEAAPKSTKPASR